ncbi:MULTISPECIES: GNAT family N-acetyltransferase [unclassified Rhizobium]|uniref:GNAT family N-acetyltransferase n=1 Tax=unclassified Rhizobium TaxID=2613769 RepID=UPI001ADB7CFB|nr:MULTISPECIES: GNAT family N-acetyltransferase [unclassified Rhizobium]MBO9099960.1 GNAT family N-acetyltransferase [Rhizobium sp. L58/93]MBO9135828.1 GNAT family N-acetyltransferase [Rhizobium sp. B209b/85]MBO9169949.1 GNAT family N-acetyltransferase [Rhizobium sp. L245/93]MBO9185907.1 GNAT family N-acetyltransferase [Rhizobium sp. E27B/91]QXZ82773.1 GNAT family N-acetyltransferase [Rhizobium sp. K1/93]
MAETPPLTFVTPRLTLRGARAEDAGSLFEEYTGRAEASRYLQRKAHRSQAHTVSIIDACGENNWAATRRFGWSVIPHDCKRAIGLFYLFVDSGDAEIHYGIGPAFWGQGLATEAGIAIMDWVVDRSSLTEVSTSCATDHLASLRVLEKIGLRRIKLLLGGLLLGSTGKPADAWLYAWSRS